jgi:hypothetical protein
MVVLYRSCRVFRKEANKIEFAFFDCSTIFYGLSKVQQLCTHYLRNYFACRPLELSFSHTSAPGLHKTP